MNHPGRIVPPLSITLVTVSATLGVATPGWAKISDTSPSKGDTVTVDADPPATATSQIKSSAPNVTVNIEKNAGIDVSSGSSPIRANGEGWQVNNAGTITSSATGVEFYQVSGSVTNTGTITSSGYRTGIEFYLASGSVTNSGTITGGSWGIYIDDGGTITNQAGGVIQGSTAISSPGPTTVTNAGTIEGQDGTAIEFALYANNADTLILQPGSSITGKVKPGGGTDTLTLGGDSGSDTFDVSDIGSGQQYQGFAAFRKKGDSTWTLTGTATGGGQDWTVAAGTLVGDTDSLQGDITDNAALTFDQSSDGTYAGVISGTGSLTKTGGGTLTLTGQNTYAGGTTLDAGTLVLGSDDALGSGTLHVTGPGAIKSSANNRSVNNDIILGNTLTVAGAKDMRLTGDISGSGGLTKTGTSGGLVLKGDNTFSGDLNINGGSVNLYNGNAVGDHTSVNLANTAYATLRVRSDETIGGLTGGGSSGGNVLLEDAAGVGRTLTVNNPADNTYSGVLSGKGGLAKTGNGKLTLTGHNTYAGGTTLAAGTLAVDNDDALGSGTLHVTGPATLEVDWRNIANQIALDQTLTLYAAGKVTGDISGPGGLTTGGREVYLTGDNTFSGPLNIHDGGVALFNGNALADTTTVNLAHSSNAFLDVADDETIGGLTGGGEVYLTDPVGTTSTTLTVANAADNTYNGVISDFGIGGQLIKQGAGTLTLTGESTYTGDTTVNAGTLAVDGSLASRVVLDGGSLQGHGVVGGIDAQSGRVAPGNSIGTLHVTGDVAFATGTTYDAQINGDGTGDLIQAKGRATLAKKSTIGVEVVDNGSLIKNGDQWTILSADDGVTDHGADVLSNLAGFNFDGAASGDSYRLTAVADALAPSQKDPTAKPVARALDADAASGHASAKLNKFITQARNRSVNKARRVLQASTPRPVAATHLVQQRVTRRFHATLGNYLRGQRMGMPGLINQAASQTAALAGPIGGQLASAAANDPRTLGLFFAQADKQTTPAADSGDAARRSGLPAEMAGNGPGQASRLGGFAAAYTVFNDRDPDHSDLGSRSQTYAGQVGLDYRLNDDWLAGVSFSYARGNINFDDQSGFNRGGNDLDTYRVGPYLGYAHGPWFADASVTYALHQNNLERRVPATGDSFDADYDSHEVAAFLGGGYAFDLGKGWNLTPQAGLQYVHTWAEGYRETGGPGALAVDNEQFSSLRSTVGVRVSKLFKAAGMQLMPHAQVGWGHEYLDDDQGVSARFVGGSNPFTIDSTINSDDSIYYGAGVTALLSENVSLNVGYQGETFENGQTHAIRAALRMNF